MVRLRNLAFGMVLLPLVAALLTSRPALAQSADAPIQILMQDYGDIIAKSSRRTVGEAIDALGDSSLEQAPSVLARWQAKEMWRHKESGLFVYAQVVDRDNLRIFDFADGREIGVVADNDYKQVKPNSGVRSMLGSALVQFQLNDPDPDVRRTALLAISRDSNASHLSALRGAIDSEPDDDIRAQKQRLERLLTIQFATADSERISAIRGFSGDMSLDVRGVLTPLVQVKLGAATQLPEADDITEVLIPGDQALSRPEAYQILVNSQLAPAIVDTKAQKDILAEHIEDGAVGGVPIEELGTLEGRATAYDFLVQQDLAVYSPSQQDIDAAIDAHVFFAQFINAPPAVAEEAQLALRAIENQLGLAQFFDLCLDVLSLASIYFLAAIGLAITFGVMRVINMAHGEFIMMGAYTGFVVQQVIPNYTLSIMVAFPLAFVITFAAGVALERLVIRWLSHRPLETLLATFGVSIALQQLAKNIFGTQARPLTSPTWLDGSMVLNDVVSISYIRIAIFVLALILLGLFFLVMNRTRLGLEVRAVSQNHRMASSMGINPERINMLTFGFGSGIAGLAGVAIGLYAKVTSEMGADYIVQSFMTVVVGGVGNIFGALLGASLVGSLQKVIEWFNPSNTLAAQTYMILFIILFIQFRPKGIIAQKGRAAEA